MFVDSSGTAGFRQRRRKTDRCYQAYRSYCFAREPTEHTSAEGKISTPGRNLHLGARAAQTAAGRRRRSSVAKSSYSFPHLPLHWCKACFSLERDAELTLIGIA